MINTGISIPQPDSSLSLNISKLTPNVIDISFPNSFSNNYIENNNNFDINIVDNAK